MSMQRRAFLGTLIAGVTGLMLPRDLLWTPSLDAGLSVKPLLPQAIVGLEHMTRAVHRELLGLITTHETSMGLPEMRIGHTLLVRGQPVTLTDQLCVDFRGAPGSIDHFGLDVERYVKPLAHSLGRAIHTRQINTFGVLPIPRGAECEAAMVSGYDLSVRGISAPVFDPTIGDWHMLTRFDVLGGHTA